MENIDKEKLSLTYILSIMYRQIRAHDLCTDIYMVDWWKNWLAYVSDAQII